MSDRPRVLVVDDEPQILRALRILLRDAGFEVLQAASVEEALDVAAVRPPEAAIVDLVLPDGDGVDITRSLRGWSEMPILVLSAVGDEDAKVRALEAGADDYVTKPFGARELVARLQAAMRRAGPGQAEPVLRADGLELDLAAHTVRVEGAEVHLTPIEFDLLRVLARNRGRLHDAPRAADRGLGTRVREGRRRPARPRREPAAQDRARRRERLATSAPTRASATASPRSHCQPGSSNHLYEICIPRSRFCMRSSRRGSTIGGMDFVAVALALLAFLALYGLIELVDRI